MIWICRQGRFHLLVGDDAPEPGIVVPHIGGGVVGCRGGARPEWASPVVRTCD